MWAAVRLSARCLLLEARVASATLRASNGSASLLRIPEAPLRRFSTGTRPLPHGSTARWPCCWPTGCASGTCRHVSSRRRSTGCCHGHRQVQDRSGRTARHRVPKACRPAGVRGRRSLDLVRRVPRPGGQDRRVAAERAPGDPAGDRATADHGRSCSRTVTSPWSCSLSPPRPERSSSRSIIGCRQARSRQDSGRAACPSWSRPTPSPRRFGHFPGAISRYAHWCGQPRRWRSRSRTNAHGTRSSRLTRAPTLTSTRPRPAPGVIRAGLRHVRDHRPQQDGAAHPPQRGRPLVRHHPRTGAARRRAALLGSLRSDVPRG